MFLQCLEPTQRKIPISFSALQPTSAMDQLDLSGKKKKGELTKREVQVLWQMAQGKSSKEISNALYISNATVRTHIQRILNKLEVHSRLEAVLKALREILL